MKIEVKKLLEFVKKASLNGTILTMYIDINKDGLCSRIKNDSNVAMTDTKLKIDVDELDFGRWYIKNSAMFMTLLKTFSGELEIHKTSEYMLRITTSTREIDMYLGSELVCDNIVIKNLPSISFSREVIVNKDILNKFATDSKIQNINELNIKTDEKKLYFIIGKEKETDILKNFMDIDVGEESSVTIGATFIDLLGSLDNNDIKMKIGTDVPVVLEQKSDDIEFVCMIAPIISN